MEINRGFWGHLVYSNIYSPYMTVEYVVNVYNVCSRQKRLRL